MLSCGRGTKLIVCLRLAHSWGCICPLVPNPPGWVWYLLLRAGPASMRPTRTIETKCISTRITVFQAYHCGKSSSLVWLTSFTWSTDQFRAIRQNTELVQATGNVLLTSSHSVNGFLLEKYVLNQCQHTCFFTLLVCMMTPSLRLIHVLCYSVGLEICPPQYNFNRVSTPSIPPLNNLMCEKPP